MGPDWIKEEFQKTIPEWAKPQKEIPEDFKVVYGEKEYDMRWLSSWRVRVSSICNACKVLANPYFLGMSKEEQLKNYGHLLAVVRFNSMPPNWANDYDMEILGITDKDLKPWL